VATAGRQYLDKNEIRAGRGKPVPGKTLVPGAVINAQVHCVSVFGN
jgi:hypothetical protein